MNILIPKTKSQALKIMGEILEGRYTTEEVVSFLSFFQDKPASPQLLNSFLKAIKATATYTVHTKDFATPLIDIAGTGGDGKNTVNISTLSALFCAATGLVNVAKYGNRAASGICGSMDVLEAHGIPVELSYKDIVQNIHLRNFSSLFARSVYPGAKNVAEARSQLHGPSIFNLLFPLARPVTGESRFVFGTADKKQLNLVSKIYAKEKNTRCLIVHGLDGTDEVSISGSGETEYVLIDEGVITEGIINCQKLFGITSINLAQLQVFSKEEAVRLFIEVCNPKFTSQKILAIRQSVYANAAVALFVGLDSGNTDIRNAKKYLLVVEESLNSGKVLTLLKNLQIRNKGYL